MTVVWNSAQRDKIVGDQWYLVIHLENNSTPRRKAINQMELFYVRMHSCIAILFNHWPVPNVNMKLLVNEGYANRDGVMRKFVGVLCSVLEFETAFFADLMNSRGMIVNDKYLKPIIFPHLPLFISMQFEFCIIPELWMDSSVLRKLLYHFYTLCCLQQRSSHYCMQYVERITSILAKNHFSRI